MFPGHGHLLYTSSSDFSSGLPSVPICIRYLCSLVMATFCTHLHQILGHGYTLYPSASGMIPGHGPFLYTHISNFGLIHLHQVCSRSWPPIHVRYGMLPHSVHTFISFTLCAHYRYVPWSWPPSVHSYTGLLLGRGHILYTHTSDYSGSDHHKQTGFRSTTLFVLAALRICALCTTIF